MNQVTGCVREAAATVGAFYTLWSLIVLQKDVIPSAATLAVSYVEFTQMAAELRAQPNTAGVQGGPGREAWPELAFTYAMALQGAHTDLSPRTTRLNALLQALRMP